MLACLWRGDDLPGYSSNKYDLGYAAKLRDMLGEQARLTLVTDFDCEEVPGIDTHRMKGIGVGGWTPVFEAFDAELWPKGNERCVLVGLDTIITGDIGWLFEWRESDVGLPLDPYYAPEFCDAVVTYNRAGAALVMQRYLREAGAGRMNSHYTLAGRPSEMVLLRAMAKEHEWAPLEAEPRRLLSYKQHVLKEGRDWREASVTYFHGDPKPHQLPEDDDLKKVWRCA